MMQWNVLSRAMTGKGAIVAAAVVAALGFSQATMRDLVAADVGAIDTVKATPHTVTATGSSGTSIPSALFDHSTFTDYAPDKDAEFTVDLGASKEIAQIKVYGPAPYLLTVKADKSGLWETISGFEKLDLRHLAEQWVVFDATSVVSARRLQFILTFKKGSKATGLKELEVWTKGRRITTKSPRDFLQRVQGALPPDNGRVFTAAPAEAVLGEGGQSRAQFRVALDVEPARIKRAWLVYDLTGAGHWIGVKRAVNGKPSLGPLQPLSGTAWSSQMERLTPETLVRGTNRIDFADGEGLPYSLRNVRLLVELEDGSNFVSNVEALPNSDTNAPTTVRDGDANTGWTPYPSSSQRGEEHSLTLMFDKPTQLSGVMLGLVNALKGKIDLEMLEAGRWGKTGGSINGSSLSTGTNLLPVSAGAPVDGVRLVFSNGEGSAATITEVVPVGSSVGWSHGKDVVVAYPLAGEYFGDTAVLRGYVSLPDNGSGLAKVTVAGRAVDVDTGVFEASVTKSDAGFSGTASDAPWAVTVEATYPDGEKISRTVALTQYQEKSVASKDVSTSKDNPGTRALTGNPYYIEHDKAVLDLDGDAMKEPPSTLTITSLQQADLPPLDPGMTNVTQGPRKGYRFGPHGKKFKKKIRVSLPYDNSKLPPGMTEADIRTYYFDENTGNWRALERVQIDKAKRQIISHTDHFTDMINATLVVPEHPEAANFNPTQIKDIKAADPGAGINLIEPPRASEKGDARLSYPIEIPAGRSGMQPQLAVQYSSGGGNGWMGIGWDLSLPSITVETRWGVPRYDAAKESETYVLSGEQLLPLAHRGEQPPRVANKEFHARVEGAFRKIVRHGDSPKNYWWEVVDKNGTRHFYGASATAGAPETNATLTTEAGAVFRWALRETIDTNGNTVRYHWKRVSDVGVAGGSVPGYQLYPTRIDYTGHNGGTGAYSVTFVRDSELPGYTRRPDITIDGRGGFKQVTAALLKRIDVHYNDQLVRRYAFDYREGAFRKTLLTTIKQFGEDGATEFNRHELEYFDDIRTANGQYKPFDAVTTWNAGVDGVTAGLLGEGNASALGGNFSESTGGHLYLGFNPSSPRKPGSIGFKGGYSRSTGEGLLALADMNGDGLPDKVYKSGNGFYYRANLSGPAGNNRFGDPVRLPTLPAISRDKVTSFTAGSENFGTISLFDGNYNFNTSIAYFTDVNGDGLTDLVNGGSVLFGYINAQGVPTFSANSNNSPVSIGSSTVMTAGLLPGYEDIYEQQIDTFPLVDTVRRWTAPFDGTVAISGAVKLVKDTTDERAVYETADGVRVAIQLEQAEIWEKRIAATNYDSHIPTGVSSVQVRRGDRLYFRVQSIFDGAYDQVDWDPEVRYVGKPVTPDANNLDQYRYQASKDFTLGGRTTLVLAHLKGTLHLTGNLEKSGITTDDVRLMVLRNGVAVIDRKMAWDKTGVIALNDDIAVNSLDELEWRVAVDSPIDLAQISWAPVGYYTQAEGVDSVKDQNGNYFIRIEPPYAIDMYPMASMAAPQQPWVVPYDGNFQIVPSLVLVDMENVPSDERPTGQINFTVKKRGALLGKTHIQVSDGVLSTMMGVTIEAKEGDELYFDFSTLNATLPAYIQEYGAVAMTGPLMARAVPTVLRSSIVAEAFPQPYRGWSAIGYNGNRGWANQPIDQNVLHIDETYRFENARIFPFAALPTRGVWGAVDEDAWVSPVAASSSRSGMDYIEVPTAEGFAGAPAVPRLSHGWQVSGGFGGVGASVGSSRSELDFQDLNGDRFPDVIGQGGVQYTKPTGALNSGAENPGISSARSSDNKSFNASISGSIAITQPDSRGRAAPGLNTANTSSQGSEMPSLGLGGSLGRGESDTNYDLIDVNGDGLPDRVHANGRVSLNLGYKFAPAENWGGGAINDGSSNTAGLNLGFSTGFYEFAGGASLSVGESTTGETYTDVNGDGLPDKVLAGSPLRVRLNTGAGFGSAISWPGSFSEIASDKNASLGGGAYFTIPVGPLCLVGCYVIINPGVNYSQSVGRPEVAFRDLDGDGFADHITSTKDNELKVARNRTGRTNLLRRVTRPLGASFEIEYQRHGNTYDQPHSQWVMSSVTVQDGHVGDGVDTLATAYDYQNGYYDRLEREFYGYRTVIEKQLDTAHDNTVYRTVTRDYFNRSYYTKGLLERELTTSGSGTKYLETVNTYFLRDVGTGNELANPASTTARVFPELSKTERRFYEGQSQPGKSTYVTYSYDAYGNVNGFFDVGEISDSGDDVYAAIAYTGTDAGHSACVSSHIVGLPVSIVVQPAKGSGAVLRERRGEYECTSGDLKRIRRYVDGQWAVTDLTYDAYGNLATITGPDDANTQRHALAFSYDSAVHTYPVRIDDVSLKYYSTASYNYKYGQAEETVDLNGNRITNRFDPFGRMVEVRGPYEQAPGSVATISFEYHPEATVPYALTRHYDRDAEGKPKDTLDTLLFTDGLKRVLQTKKDISLYVAGSPESRAAMSVSGRVLFDHVGRAVKQYYTTWEAKGANIAFNAAFDDEPPTFTEYDVLDRAVRITLPDGSVTRHAYGFGTTDALVQFKTATTDAEGNKREVYKDVRELITAVREFNPAGGQAELTTRYRYDRLKQIVEVKDAKGHLTTVQYDTLGRRTAINNPDTGLIEKRYDRADNVIAKITPTLRKDGKAIGYRYNYGQLVAIDYPNGVNNDVRYQYGEDTAQNRQVGRVGRLTRVDHESGYEERWYGKLGETVKETKYVHLPQSEWHSGAKHNQGKTQPQEYEVFTTQYAYDTFGRLMRLTYPDGEVLTYRYDSGGLAESVHGSYKGAPYAYVKRIGYDEFEQRMHVELGNGAVTDYAYEAKTRRLANLKSQSLGYRFQNLHYSYDRVGNVTALLNDVSLPTDGMGGLTKQQFVYDNLYRLIQASGLYQGAPDSKEEYTLSMAYDGVHNITRKTQVHKVVSLNGSGNKHHTTYDWSYQYNAAQPHAPSHIGERAYRYDLNGNQLGWTHDRNATNRQITWDDENRIQAINDQGGEYSTYDYDDAGQRVIKQARQNLTVYVNQYFTERNGSIGSKHVFVGTTRMVTKVTGGTLFIRSYDGETGAKLPPGQAQQTEKSNNGKAPDKANNGKAVGQDQEKTNNGRGTEMRSDKAQVGNGNAKGKSEEKANGKAQGPLKSTAGKVEDADGFRGQGVEHRSDRANEVAQNTCKNKHLAPIYCNDGGGVDPTDPGDGTVPGDGTNPGTGTPPKREVVKVSMGEQLFYYHSDHLGSTGYVTRENGKVHEHIQYFPFGETWVQQGGNTEKSPYLFTSKELDEETGLYYFGARYYDPKTSVWLSTDPILASYLEGKPNAGVYDPVNLGLYIYTGNNPVIYIDPDGRVRWRDAFVSTLGIASNGAGIVVGGALVTGGAALVAAPEPTMLTKVAGVGSVALGGTVWTKSVAGVALNAANLRAAIEDKDPYVPGSAAQVIAEAVAPGNEAAKGIADAADLTLDLATGRAPAGTYVDDVGRTVAGGFNKLQDIKAAQQRVQGTPLIATEATGKSAASTAVDTLQAGATLSTSSGYLPKSESE